MGNQMAVGGMAMLRVVSGLIEIAAALIILRVGRVEAALRINSILGLVGPVVFIAVSALGIITIAVKLPPLRIVLLVVGILMVLLGTTVKA